jgi:hypothetical protein
VGLVREGSCAGASIDGVASEADVTFFVTLNCSA